MKRLEVLFKVAVCVTFYGALMWGAFNLMDLIGEKFYFLVAMGSDVESYEAGRQSADEAMKSVRDSYRKLMPLEGE